MSAIFKMLASAFVRLPRQLASDLLASQELASVARVRFAASQIGRGFIGYPKGRNRDIKLVN